MQSNCVLESSREEHSQEEDKSINQFCIFGSIIC